MTTSPQAPGHVGAEEVRQAWCIFHDIQTLWASRGYSADELQDQLSEKVDSVIQRTREVLSGVSDATARKAVLLLTSRDFMDIAVESTLTVLRDREEDDVTGDVLKGIATHYSKLCDTWRELLEEQEASARDEIHGHSEQMTVTKAASCELLKAAEQLHKDSADLASQNKRLQLEVGLRHNACECTKQKSMTSMA